MAAIIDYTAFVQPIYIDTSDVDVKADLVNYCAFVQEKMLKKLLGETLYNDYLSHSALAKYTTLINGDAMAYTYGGVTRLYTGLKTMLANFTYCEYVPDMTSINTKSGQKIEKSNKNFDSVTDERKLGRAWNEGVRLFYEAIDYINYKNGVDPTLYVDFDPRDLKTVNSFRL